ncbi:unnamed protein product [Coregonus sp. 'balchen']|nr:unnamed protein product [Coregonus sp. 'balchen']
MSSSMGSGMFPGQQPAGPHPVGGPGQPGLLPGGAPGNRVQGPNTLVDDLEASFEACFASLVSQDYVNGTDQEEIRTGVDQCIQKFLDVLEDVSVQHRKPSDLPPPGPLAFLEQASASLPPAPLKQT